MVDKRVIVAIDGPAGAGKSTIARRVADKLGYVYINSGAMYRAVALWALRLKTELTDMHRLEQLAREARIELQPGGLVFLNGEDVTEADSRPRGLGSSLKSLRGSCGATRTLGAAKVHCGRQ